MKKKIWYILKIIVGVIAFVLGALLVILGIIGHIYDISPTFIEKIFKVVNISWDFDVFFVLTAYSSISFIVFLVLYLIIRDQLEKINNF